MSKLLRSSINLTYRISVKKYSTDYEKLNKMLRESSGSEIYCFVELLEALGFKLGITVEDGELGAECDPNCPIIVEIGDRV
jgi:hypothetical protein